METKNSTKNDDSKYIKEKIVKGHGNPISIKQLKDIIEKGENSIFKIDYLGEKGTGFFFQQNIPTIKYNNKYFLMTNNHVLNSECINNNDQLVIEYKNKEKIIPLNNRIKYTNELLDFTIIEILPTDSFFSEIKYFFTIDNYIMNNNSESKYLEQDICIFQYPKGEELSFDKGEIKSINNHIIKHLVSTHPGSSGSPILLLNNFKIIGIHQAGNKEDNKGIFMKNILNDINNINYKENNLNNYIICEYHIKKEKINQPIQIINSYEETKRKYPDGNWKNIKAIENEKEIKENCEIYLNNKRIDFCYEYKFEKEDKNEIKIISKTPLNNTNFMFFNCSSLTSLNLSNFNTNNVTNMNSMFSNCSSLTSLNLSNFNTNNVTDMCRMFSGMNKGCKLICNDKSIVNEFS